MTREIIWNKFDRNTATKSTRDLSILRIKFQSTTHFVAYVLLFLKMFNFTRKTSPPTRKYVCRTMLHDSFAILGMFKV